MTQPPAEYITWMGAFAKGLEYGLTHTEGVTYADSTVRMVFGPNPTSEAQSSGKCHYCEQNDADGNTATNPYNGKELPTCAVCQYDFLLEADRLRKAKPMRLGAWLAVLAGGGIAVVSNTAVGLLLAGLGVLLLVACGRIWSRDERDEKLLEYAEEHGLHGHPLVTPNRLRWCLTCVHFRKQARWADAESGQWRSESHLPDEQLPCSNARRAAPAWREYFAMPADDRACFPKSCEEYAPQIGVKA